MKTKDGNAIYKILRQHHGRQEAISAPSICRALGWPARRERLVRQIIADESALWPDTLICAVPGEGFFCAATFEEIVFYDNWLSEIARTAADKVAVFRHTAKALGFNIVALPPLKHAA